ncbi:uncharacterized protein CIMG_12646 [Coccidioides immitis RS]|uniref:Uncharacterized protein n=1 Tax=Coccidioides immitis (strain RS) TaxID=246410 RepID=A0A0D8JRQ5_COCIM|nr:uncharacterized protein CIMG_12646 [Coccidioides immitis RS]KJF59972.1 hypothetical protein CIMG_12646 [Coccidioides immitis RS]
MNDMKNKEKERQRAKRPKAQSNKQPKRRVAEGDRWLEGSERDGEADFVSDVGRRTVTWHQLFGRGVGESSLRALETVARREGEGIGGWVADLYERVGTLEKHHPSSPKRESLISVEGWMLVQSQSPGVGSSEQILNLAISNPESKVSSYCKRGCVSSPSKCRCSQAIGEYVGILRINHQVSP